MNLDRVIAVRNNKTVYRDADRCIKVFHDAFSKADVLSEALNQASVEEIGLHVPKILEVTVISGKWAIVSEYIRGTTLERMMQQDPDHSEKHIAHFVDLQREIHSKAASLPIRLEDQLRRNITCAQLDAALQRELLTRLADMPCCESICHGDFSPSNIILTDSKDAYILDWADAALGDPAADAARTYLLLQKDLGSCKADQYLELFCRKSKMAKSHIQAWIPLVAASRLIVSNESEREFLMSWICDADPI